MSHLLLHYVHNGTGELFFLSNNSDTWHGMATKPSNNPVSEGGFRFDTRTPWCERQ